MKKGYICISEKVFSTLLAVSPKEQEAGLMYQPWPPPVMSFVYSKPKVNNFWMHNTPSPLDIIFCKEGKIVDIRKGEPYSTSLIGVNDVTDLIVEFPHGTAKKFGFKPNDTIILIDSDDEIIKK